MLDVDDIVTDFELLGEWEMRYAYLIELGEALPPMDDALKIDENQVKGCISKVWVHARHDDESGSLIRYDGDCDTPVIKGVLALLIDLLSKRKSADILQLDVDDLFERLQLAEHLSPNRHFGIYAIVELMKSQAAALDDAATIAVNA